MSRLRKLVLISVLLLVGLISGIHFSVRLSAFQNGPGQSDEPAKSKIIQLDTRGTRGVVSFNHRPHEMVINPDPNAPFKTKPGAACLGCHHTISTARGVPQLWKCSACHREEGNPQNPKNKDFDEVWSERAFHDLCINCHRASNQALSNLKGPTTCGECHKPEMERASGGDPI
jgi:hypothetical protein